MNSGCYNDDVSKILLSIKAIDKKNLTEVELKREEIDFFIEERIYQRIS